MGVSRRAYDHSLAFAIERGQTTGLKELAMASRSWVVIVLASLLGGCASTASPLATGPSSLAPTGAVVSPAALSAAPGFVLVTVPGGLAPGRAAVTLVSGLRVRSQPRISDDSKLYEPLLSAGTQLYVLSGPVSASGYSWYEVVRLGSGTMRVGWVASAAREGEPWLSPRDFACPALPTDFRSLAALGLGVGLACFPRTNITVRARLVSCACEIDPGGLLRPEWFNVDLRKILIVDPSSDRPPEASAKWFWLVLDPSGEYPDPLPAGHALPGNEWSQVPAVDVTGGFDHPAGASCTDAEAEEPTSRGPSQICRLSFGVTKVTVVQS